MSASSTSGSHDVVQEPAPVVPCTPASFKASVMETVARQPVKPYYSAGATRILQANITSMSDTVIAWLLNCDYHIIAIQEHHLLGDKLRQARKKT